MSDVLSQLPHLSVNERLAVAELLHRLEHEFGDQVLEVVIYGSSARGDRGADSDVDLLIITRHDDWREHEPIRFLTARLSSEYDVFLSARVMGQDHYRRLCLAQPLFYLNVQRDGLQLMGLDDSSSPGPRQPVPA